MEGDTNTSGPAGPKPAQEMSAGNKTTLRVILAAGLIVGAAAIWIGTRPVTSKPQQTAAAASPSPSASPAPVNETASEPVRIDYPAADGNTLSAQATVSIVVPKLWRTQILGDPMDPATECRDLVEMENCFSFRFANALGSPTSLLATNTITLFNLTGWTAHDGPDSPGEVANFGGTTDPTQKRALVAATMALSPSSKLNPASISELFNPFTGNAGFVGASDVAYIQSADGTLKGYSFIASLVQNGGYQPDTFAVLVGQEHGVIVAVGGEFRLNDALRKTDPTGAAFDNAYVPGYQYGRDTLAQNSWALSVMKTVKLTF